MIYILLDDSLEESLVLKGENYKYIVKARRHQEGDEISVRSKRNLEILYTYSITSIQNRSVELSMLSKKEYIVKAQKPLHVGWCIIDFKSVERVLPSLSEIGVSKITFINCQRSQNSFKVDTKRLTRIVEASMQQSGRSETMEFSTCKSVENFIELYPQTKVFDFTDVEFDSVENIDTVLIGCEGGFSKNEKELLRSQEVFKLNTKMVLRSESAVMAVASKVLL